MSAGALVIAHRGASGERPENTMAAYALALEQRADMIEIDLHRTRDGAIVVTHDETLERIGGSGEVGDATLAQLRALDAGGGEPVPTLDEVLDAFGTKIPFNLELKRARRGAYPGLEAAVLDAVRERGLLERMLFSCFWDPVLAELRRLEPAARVGLLLSPRHPVEPFARAKALAAEAIHPETSLVTGQLVEKAHGEGLAVYPYTADAPEELERLLDLCVDGIFTNHPARLRALQVARGREDGPRGRGGSARA